MRKHWDYKTDIPWDEFDASKVNPDLLKVVKAAAMVEANAPDYAAYLCSVFHDDPEFQAEARHWGLVEEVQHGESLGHWAMRADPSFDYEGALRRFRDGYKIDIQATESVRGSRSAELVTRCMVEVGTSSFYSALGASTNEPALKAICQHIVADELRHYKMFYTNLRRYVDREHPSKLKRLRVAVGRIVETEDDELAYAYYAANTSGSEPYDRAFYSREYLGRAYRFYKPNQIDRAVGMIFKACGLSPQSRIFDWTRRVAWRFVDWRSRRMLKPAAA
jgi:rubrerythrin